MYWFICHVDNVLVQSRLEELLGSDDSSFSFKTLVTLEDLSSKPHEPERILDSESNHLQFKQWMDGSIEDATYKNSPPCGKRCTKSKFYFYVFGTSALVDVTGSTPIGQNSSYSQ